MNRLSQFSTVAIVAAAAACTAPRPAPRPAPALVIEGHDPVPMGTADAGAPAPSGAPSNAAVVAIAAKYATACALHEDGSVSCWGSGFGTSPVRVRGLVDVVAIDGAGRSQITARTRSGDVFGVDDVTKRLPFSGPAREAHGGCALLASGAVECLDERKRVGKVKLSNVTHVVGDAEQGCAAHDDTVTCWEFDVPTDVKLAGVEELVVANRWFHCARIHGGDVVCWGARTPPGGPRAMPVLPSIVVAPRSLGLHDAIALIDGDGAVCARRADRSIVCVDASFDRPLVLRPGSRDVDAFARGGGFSCGLSRGVVSCEGANDYGQLGAAIEPYRTWAAPVTGVTSAVAVQAGMSWSCALGASGTASCWGKLLHGASATATELHGVVQGVELGGFVHPCVRRRDGKIECREVSLELPIRVADVPTSEGFSKYFGGCSISRGGVHCWDGSPPFDGSSGAKGAPGIPGILDAKAIAVGGAHACVLRANGEVVRFGSTLLASRASDGGAPTATPVPGFRKSVAVGAASDRCCALGDDGSVACATADDATATRVPTLEHVEKLSVGTTATCAIAGGAVWCWGESVHGECGVIERRVPEPRKIGGLHDPVAVSVGEHHACALERDGTVACWGETLHGAAGTNVSGRSDHAVAVRLGSVREAP